MRITHNSLRLTNPWPSNSQPAWQAVEREGKGQNDRESIGKRGEGNARCFFPFHSPSAPATQAIEFPIELELRNADF